MGKHTTSLQRLFGTSTSCTFYVVRSILVTSARIREVFKRAAWILSGLARWSKTGPGIEMLINASRGNRNGEGHRPRIRILWILPSFFIREFYWILNCLLNVIFKIRTLILAEKLIARLHSHRNTQKRQVRLKSVLFRVRISNSPLFPFNSHFNIVHNLKVLQFNHKTYQ